MTTADVFKALIEANLAAAVAILFIMALRSPVRRGFGARVAYGLWALAPLAAFATLIPARSVTLITPTLSSPAMGAATPTLDLAGPALWLWLAGGAVFALFFASRQRRFLAEAAEGGVGPAVVGVFSPRIILPKDFEDRFAPEEQHVVLAHETAHLKAHDARINAFVALAQCVCWFNPLVHVAAMALRTDQELACDAVVLARHPTARRAYAEALLKTQLAATPLPLGCYWPPRSDHPLTQRIAMLKLSSPTRSQRYLGATAVGLLSLGAGVGAWAAQPPRTFVAATAPMPIMIAEAAIADEPQAEPAPAVRPTPTERRARAEAIIRQRGMSQAERDTRRQAMQEAIAAVRETEGEHRELTPEQRARVDEALARAREAIAGAEARNLEIGPRVEEAMKLARQRLEDRRIGQEQPLNPEDRAAMDKARQDLEGAREDLRKAQQDMAKAREAMVRAQADLMTRGARSGDRIQIPALDFRRLAVGPGLGQKFAFEFRGADFGKRSFVLPDMSELKCGQNDGDRVVLCQRQVEVPQPTE